MIHKKWFIFARKINHFLYANLHQQPTCCHQAICADSTIDLDAYSIFRLRNFAHQKTLKHKSIVVESKAYTLPPSLKISVLRFVRACSTKNRHIPQICRGRANSRDCSVVQTSLQATDSNWRNA